MAAQSEPTPSFHYARIAAVLMRRTLFFGAAAGLFAVLYALTLDNEYQSQAGLLLAPLPMSEALNAKGTSLGDSPAAQLGYLMSRPLTVPGYEVLLRNDSIVQALRLKLQEIRASEGHKELPSLESIRKAMSVQTRILKQTSSDVEYAPLIALAFNSSSPALAADMANEWARLAVEASKEVSAKGGGESLELLSGRLDAIVEDLRRTETSVQEHGAVWDIEGMTERLAEWQAQATQFDKDLLSLSIDIDGTRAELSSVEEALAGVGETVTLRKAMPDEAYWLAPEKTRSDSSNVLETEEVSTVFVTLTHQKHQLQGKLAGSLDRKNATSGALDQLKGQIAQLQKDLAEQKRVQVELNRQADVYAQQYKLVAENLEAARIADSRTEADLKVAYSAVPPERKVGPHRSLIVLTAALLGALVVPLHFLVRSSLRRLATHLDSTVTVRHPPGAA